MAKAPFAIVKERFKDKAGLVSAVQALISDDLWLDRVKDKGLERVSNKKLLHLHQVLTEVKSKFGSRAKLITAIADAEGRAKDGEYKKGLERHPTVRLLEIVQTSQKRKKKAAN